MEAARKLNRIVDDKIWSSLAAFDSRHSTLKVAEVAGCRRTDEYRAGVDEVLTACPAL